MGTSADELSGDSVKEADKVSQSCSPPSSAIVVPLTPDPNRENVEQRPEFLSPLTVMFSSPEKETLFDSFAPGPDKCVLAPHHNKYKGQESRVHVVRRLDFTSLITSSESNLEKNSDDEDEEHYLFRIVYGAILDAIVSEQQTKQLVVVSAPGTPKSAPHLSWIAKTCPGAPIKPTSKFRSFDNEICKKLEF